MGWPGRLLKVLPGEGRLAARVLALMVSVWAGFGIGGSAVEGLLLSRVGPGALPYLYVALGITTAAVMLGMNAVLARPRSQGLLLRALPVAAVVVLGLRLLLLFGWDWVYLVAWLSMMVLWTGAIVVTWGIAGALHDARQAKRLFPIYASGVILGVALGGLATAPLARWVGAENLVVLWAAALAAGFAIGRSAVRVAGVRPSRVRRSTISVRARVVEGIEAVRTSPLLTLMAVLSALFAMLYFSLALLFAEVAAARFPDADGLASFLGLFMGAATGTALLATLFGANRLNARYGVVPAIVAFALIYLGGFAALLASLAFVSLLAFRFVQIVWMTGIWNGAWQALYNVVPPDRREATRAFVEGVAFQGGVVLAGLVLILANRVEQPRVVALFGVLLAGLASLAALRLRRAYADGVMAALRAGNPDVFFVEHEPLGGIGRDPAALSVAERAASDPDASVRRMALEVLGEVGERDAQPVLRRALGDTDPTVRAAALRGLARSGAGNEVSELESVAAALRDEDASVRLAAVDALAASSTPEPARLQPVLVDPDLRVRARAAALLLATSGREEARATLASMAGSREGDARAEAVRAWAAADGGVAAAAAAVSDPDPMVRRAAVSALAGRAGVPAIEALVRALGDSDRAIRSDAVDGLVGAGRASIPALLKAADRPELEDGAMRALARLHAVGRSEVDEYVQRKVSDAVRCAAFRQALGDGEGPRLALVAHALRHASRGHAVDALLAASPSWDSRAVEAVALAVDNLEARDAAQRANAVEMLEAVGHPEVVRPLLAVWERRTASSRERRAVLADLMRERDAWLRASAAFAAPVEPGLRPVVQELASSDPDSLVRAAASTALTREESLETLTSLSLMERILFLRGVSLFRDLSPDDLKQVAEVSTEHAFSDGAVIAEQGEPGDEMHVVVSGEISVLVGRGGESPLEVARRAAGECVGEMAIVSRASRMATLTARGSVRTLAIDRRRFERILRDRPEASLAVMGVLCDRLRELHGAEPPEARS